MAADRWVVRTPHGDEYDESIDNYAEARPALGSTWSMSSRSCLSHDPRQWIPVHLNPKGMAETTGNRKAAADAAAKHTGASSRMETAASGSLDRRSEVRVGAASLLHLPVPDRLSEGSFSRLTTRQRRHTTPLPRFVGFMVRVTDRCRCTAPCDILRRCNVWRRRFFACLQRRARRRPQHLFAKC